MKFIFALLLFISATAIGQVEDSTKYIWYKYQYGSRMPRFWADSVIHVPFIDTTGNRPDRPGALIVCTCDTVLYNWNGIDWVVISGGSIVTLTNTGSGYRLVKTPDGQIKSIIPGYGINADSTADEITIEADTSELVTPSDLAEATTFTPASVPFAGSDGTLQEDNTNFRYDSTNKGLTIRRDNLGVTQSLTSGLILTNNQAAASAAQQISPAIRWRGYGWKTDATAASQPVDFRAHVLPVQGAFAATSLWQLQASVNDGSYSTRIQVSNNAITGEFTSGGLRLSGGGLSFAATPVANNFTWGAATFQIGSTSTTTSAQDVLTFFGTGTATSGVTNFTRFNQTFQPTSGTGEGNIIVVNPTINQTGGANGITRGLYVNPTLTASADFRAIETTAGDVYFSSLDTDNTPPTTTGTTKVVISDADGKLSNTDIETVGKNFAEDDLEFTGDRTHDADGNNLTISNIGQLNINSIGTTSGRQQYAVIRTVPDNLSFPLAIRYAMSKADLSGDSISTNTDMNSAGLLTSVTEVGTGKSAQLQMSTNGIIAMKADSVRLYAVPHSGAGLPDSVLVAGVRQLTGTTQLGTTTVYSIPRSALFPSLNGSTTHDFGSLSNNSSATTTIAVTGAVDGDFVLVTKPAADGWSNGESYTAWVSGPDEVTVRQNNNSGGTAGFGSQNINVKVIKQ